MPITVQLGEAVQELAGKGGPLDADQVYFQFVCTTGDGGHNPEGAPDDRVRPEHAALHGTVWRLDDPSAPIPPLNYGCRCSMRYVAAPNTTAARVLDEAPAEPESDPQAPAERYLEKHAPAWEEVATAAAEAPPAQATATAYEAAKGLGYTRDIARMALEIRPPPAVALLGTGPLTGVGRAGRVLVERWRAGDLKAAADLRRKYPATYARILRQEELPEPP